VAVFFHTSIFSMSVVIHRKNRCAKFFDFCVIFFIFAFVYTSIFSMCEVRLSKKSMRVDFVQFLFICLAAFGCDSWGWWCDGKGQFFL